MVNAVIATAMLHITFDRSTHGRPFCAEPIRWYSASMLILTAL